MLVYPEAAVVILLSRDYCHGNKTQLQVPSSCGMKLHGHSLLLQHVNNNSHLFQRYLHSFCYHGDMRGSTIATINKKNKKKYPGRVKLHVAAGRKHVQRVCWRVLMGNSQSVLFTLEPEVSHCSLFTVHWSLILRLYHHDPCRKSSRLKHRLHHPS